MESSVEQIAVTGLSCRFPGADGPRELWDGLRRGQESLTSYSVPELERAGVPRQVLEDPAFVPVVGVMPDYDRFDAELFGMTPREAAVCDPQLRALLELAHAAVTDAGYDPFHAGAVVGMFGSVGGPTYGQRHLAADCAVGGRTSSMVLSLNNVDYAATLASYKLNLTGPSLTVVTACSSSLVATHLACQSLRLGECDMALAGGVNLELDALDGYLWAPGGVRSRDGHCRPFDANANGTVFTSGGGVVVLKRLADALADGDHIRAVIRGIAINNDGADKLSFGAPSPGGQVACILDAMRAAGVRPDAVDYVEAHGTGTALGDPVEVRALTEAWRQLGRAAPGSCGLGSVKSNLGHMVQAAGVAGLIKMTLALEHGEFPPTANATSPNPKLGLESTPFFLSDTLQDWPRRPGRERIGAVNSMGVGGTNVHVVVAEAPQRAPAVPAARPRVVLWSARTPAAARACRARLGEYFAGPGAELYDEAVSTLQHAWARYRVRGAAVASDAASAAAALASAPAEGPINGGPAAVCFLFPGQGSLYPAMGHELSAEAAFRDGLEACWEAFGPRGAELRQCWEQERDQTALAQTGTAQPLLFAVEYALAQLWLSWGIRPDVVVGHSVGELTAATVAGVFSLADAAALVAARAEAMQTMPAGAMAAVLAPVAEIADRVPPTLAVAAVNGPREIVVSGPDQEIEKFVAQLRAERVKAMRLRTSHAFHSPAMAEALPRFQAAFAAVTPAPPATRVVSCATGQVLTAQEAADPGFWTGQLVRPVRFADAVRTAMASGPVDFIEIGPGHALTTLVRGLPEFGNSGRAVASLPRDRRPADERRGLMSALAEMWAAGHDVDWAAVDQDLPLRRVPVPGYPYERVRHWVDAAAPGADASAGPGAPAAATADGVTRDAGTPGHPVTADTPFTVRTWHEQSVPGPAAERYDEPALVLLPADPELSLPVVTALARAGYRVLTARPAGRYACGDGELTIRPDQPGDIGRLVGDLSRRGVPVRHVVHALAVPDWPEVTAGNVDEQAQRSALSLLRLVQQAARASRGQPPSVTVLTRRAVDVSGGEQLDVVKSALAGMVRTLAAEEPRTQPRLIDLGPGPFEERLLAELRAPVTTSVVALRGARRWVEHDEPFAPRPGSSPIRREGAYLITGGLGGLGLALATGLARTGLRPQLILVGREVPGEGAEADGTGRWAAANAALAQIRALGATVRCIAADVADQRQLSRALDVAAAYAGALHGVFHLAGVAGDGMLLLRDPAHAAAVLRPKVRGTAVLCDLLRDRTPLDFLVFYSSLAGARGFVGGGDYAAANAVLDAWATAAAGSCRVLSISWPAWAGAGMAGPALAGLAGGQAATSPVRGQGDPGPAPGAEDSVGPDAPAGVDDLIWETSLSPERTWALDEHRVGEGHPVLPGTGHLDLIVRGYRDRIGVKPDAAVQIREAVFQAPLTAAGERQVRVRFRPEAQRWAVVVESRAESGSAWQVHVTGQVADVAAEAPTANIAALRSRFADAPLEQEDRPGPSRMFTLGPRWQNLAAARQVADEKLVEIRLPEAFETDLAEHVLHPAVLDAATGALRDAQRDGPYIPFAYRSLTVYDALPGTVISHVRRRHAAAGSKLGDIDIIAPDGAVVVRIEGFAMRAVQRPAFEAGLGEEASRPAADQNGGPDPAAAPPPAAGLESSQGVRLALQLLASDSPAHVMVEPFRGGRPVRPDGAWARPAPAGSPDPAAGPGATPAPDGPMLSQLRSLWAEFLGSEDVGPDDDFFDLGGNSLSAVELMTAIRERLGIEMSIAMLLDAPTLGAMEAALRELSGA
jgi:phthiocerol/phenolphthiocerol synthesis type-I polyketide synthase E